MNNKMIYILFFFVILTNRIIYSQNCTSRYLPYYKGTCKSISTCTGAILNNLCPGDLKCCITDLYYNSSYFSFISQDNLVQIAGDTERIRFISKVLLDPLNFGSTCFQKAEFLTQLIYESNYFENIEEIGNETYFTKYDGRIDLGNTSPGDGAKYRGRGFIKLTGKANYKKAGDFLNLNLVSFPELAAFPSVAARISVWYWKYGTSKDLNNIADGTFYNYLFITSSLNEELANLDTKTLILEKTIDVLNCGKLSKGNGEDCSFQSENGKCRPLCVTGLEGKDYCGCNGKVNGGLCDGPINIKCCVEKCSNIMDLTFLIDSSASVFPYDFSLIKAFVTNMIKKVNFGEMGTRVAIINFSDKVEIVSYLNSYFKLNEILNVVNNITQIKSATFTGEALSKCFDIYSIGNGMRDVSEGANKIIIILTDGQSNGVTRPSEVADALKNQGITIISIGVGNQVSYTELRNISTSNNYLLINDFQTVFSYLDDIVQSTCLRPAEISKLSNILSVDKESFKYYKYPLESYNNSMLYISVSHLVGNTKIFTSFENVNPNDLEIVKTKKSTQRLSELNKQTKFIPINLTDFKNFSYVYVGIKGLYDTNKFVLKFLTPDEYNSEVETVNNGLKTSKSILILIINILVFSIYL